MIHVTQILSEFAARLQYDELTPEAIESTKMYIADYYAACFAGHMVNTAFNNAVESVLYDMGGKEEVCVLFGDIKLPAANAAFLNAVYAHGADMDDGNRKAMGHVGAHVMSAVFALAETLDVSGKDVFTAINVGYEVYNRVAAAVQPGLVHRGFHSTGTAGAIACGAACAKLMGMDAKGIYHTMALCAIQASGLIIIAESGQACKPINPANAAKTGIMSARMIEKGIESSVYPLESKKGWFHAMSDELDENMITDDLGEQFSICDSYLKPYPSCRHTHCGIEAALNIRREILAKGIKLNARVIKALRVHIYNNAIQIAGQIKVPKTQDDSKFSIHYSLATALMTGHFNLHDLDTASLSSDVLGLIDKIELIPDASMENREEGIRGASLEVEMMSDEIFSSTVLIPKGDAANPFSWEDMAQKMTACMEGYYDRAGVNAMIHKILSLDSTETFGSIKNIL